MHRNSAISDRRILSAPAGLLSPRRAAMAAGLQFVACLLIAATLTGCGNAPPVAGSPVNSGTATNALPPALAQVNVNRYVALDVDAAFNAVDVDLWISHPDNNYNYQQLGAAGTGTVNAISGGIFRPLSDMDYLAETDRTISPYTFAGFAAENQSDVSLLEYGYGGGPFTPDFEIGVPIAKTGCIAPSGTVPFTFLRIPVSSPLTYSPGTDSLYGTGKMTYKNGTYSFSSIQESTASGGAASTFKTPFAPSYCIQSFDGYAIEAGSTKVSSTETDTMLIYLGPTGAMVGAINSTLLQPDGTYANGGRTNILGIVQASSAIDLTKVTQGTYRALISSRIRDQRVTRPILAPHRVGYLRQYSYRTAAAWRVDSSPHSTYSSAIRHPRLLRTLWSASASRIPPILVCFPRQASQNPTPQICARPANKA